MVENYKGVFDNRIGFGKRPAMLLIDFVEAYFDKSCPLYANCLLYTSPSPRDQRGSRMPSSA